jgi:hypothetical protein
MRVAQMQLVFARSAIRESDRVTPEANPKDSPARDEIQRVTSAWGAAGFSA